MVCKYNIIELKSWWKWESSEIKRKEEAFLGVWIVADHVSQEGKFSMKAWGKGQKNRKTWYYGCMERDAWDSKTEKVSEFIFSPRNCKSIWNQFATARFLLEIFFLEKEDAHLFESCLWIAQYIASHGKHHSRLYVLKIYKTVN